MLGLVYVGIVRVRSVPARRGGFVCRSVKMGSRWLDAGDLWMNSGFVM